MFNKNKKKISTLEYFKIEFYCCCCLPFKFWLTLLKYNNNNRFVYPLFFFLNFSFVFI